MRVLSQSQCFTQHWVPWSGGNAVPVYQTWRQTSGSVTGIEISRGLTGVDHGSASGRLLVGAQPCCWSPVLSSRLLWSVLCLSHTYTHAHIVRQSGPLLHILWLLCKGSGCTAQLSVLWNLFQNRTVHKSTQRPTYNTDHETQGKTQSNN